MTRQQSVPDNTPVIVGVGQVNDHGIDAEPIEMMVTAVDAALRDACAQGIPSDAIDWVRVPWGVWPYSDPGRLVADRIGASTARTTKTTVGGNQVYDLLIDSAQHIASGQSEVVVVCGAETQRSRTAARRAGRLSAYLDQASDATPDETFGSAAPLAMPAEEAIGLNAPIVFYAMAESAIRHRRHETIAKHADRIAELWARGARVASTNPAAWITDPPSATEIATPSASNRPITAPYTKLLTSNLAVNQCGAFIVCSAGAARRYGVGFERWVFPHSGVAGADPQFMTQRWAFDESPSMRIAGRRALELAGADSDDCALVDLYSCFPAAVQVAQREIGIDPDREWTITGGLTFAAGPLNCYCLLPTVRAVELLRSAPDEMAFLTGNGGYFTKHSFVTLSGRPPSNGFSTDDVQAAIDHQPTRPAPVGPLDSRTLATATIDAYTVSYDRDGQPDRAFIAVLDRDGARHFATSTDPDTMADLIDHDRVGDPPPPAAMFTPR